MATLKQLLAARVDELEQAPERLRVAYTRLRATAYQRLLERLGQLQQKDGRIVPTAANLRRAAAITEELRGLFSSAEYLAAVADFARSFDRTKKANDELLKKAFPDYTPPALGEAVLKNSQARAVELLVGATPQSNFLEPLRTVLDRAVTSGADWRELVAELRTVVAEDGQQYVKQVAWDTLAVSDRSYAQAAGRELGVQWYLYAGTELPTTRDFCKERLNKYYHASEVESWASLEWDGKMEEATNEQTIFSTLGGWNCRHVLLPVSESVVPAEDRARIP